MSVPGSEAGSGTNAAWEDSVELLLCRWARDCKARATEHEVMARRSEKLSWLSIPLVLFPLLMAPMAGPWAPTVLSPASKSLAFVVCAVCVAVFAYLNPNGWKERHLEFAERYFELELAISAGLDQSKACGGTRRRRRRRSPAFFAPQCSAV